MNRGYLVISLIILSTLVSSSFLSSGYVPQVTDNGFRKANSNFIANQYSVNQYQMLNNVFKDNISLEKVYREIKTFTAEYGGLKARDSDTDSFANSTFWGSLALYLMEKTDDYKDDTGNFEAFLSYLYDEKTGGFRDWIEGTPTPTSTGFGVLLLNITGTTLSGFDRNKTISYLKNYIENSTEHDLMSISMSSIALSVLGYNTSNYTLADEILTYYTGGHFEDPELSVNVLVQTFFAVKALKYLNYNLTSVSGGSITYLLGLKRSGSYNGKSYSGFGLNDDPTVFETGIVLDLLREFGYDVETLRDNVTNFILLCYSDGGFYSSVNSNVTDIYQITGAVLSMYDLGYFYDYFKYSATISVGDQIPVDLNVTEVELSVKLDSEAIGYLTVSSNVTGEMFYDSQAKVYKGVMFPKNLSFGNYVMVFKYKPSSKILSNFEGEYKKSFRVGYKLLLNPSETTVHPGGNFSIGVDVTFNNGTYATNGSLIYSLKSGNITVAEGNVSLRNGTVAINITVPTYTPLGEYGFKVYVNDSHGFNHTYGKLAINIDDLLIVKAIEGNKTTYHLGESISVNVTIVYNKSGAYIPQQELEVYYVTHGDTYNGTANWVNSTTMMVNVNVTNKLSIDPVIVLKLKILWATGKTSVVDLFHFNVTTSDLVYKFLGGADVYIGDSIPVKIELYSNTTGVDIAEAKMSMVIYEGNTTYQTVPVFYNGSSNLYYTNTTLDPNIPAGTYRVNITVYDPTVGGTRVVNATDLYVLNVLGYPEIDENTLERIPDSPQVGDIIVINFKVKVKEIQTTKYLKGLRLLANISDGDNVETLYVGESNGTYTVSFKAEAPVEYNITIFRESDNYVLKSIVIGVIKQEPSLYEILEPYILGALWVASLGVAAVYFVARYLVGRRVSKRYLVKKAKKGKKARKRKKK